MTILQSIVLGIIQGLTEFLPVSSSGHLVLFQHLFGFKEPLIAFDVTLHLGTLMAVLIYFRRELGAILGDTFLFLRSAPTLLKEKSVGIKTPAVLLAGWVIVAMIPTGIIAILFKDIFEKLFTSLHAVSIAWIVMGVILIASRKFPKGERGLLQMNLKDALWVGLIQGVAIMPGVSRSGSTILAGMSRKINPTDAARFSFLIAIPAILGAAVLELRHGIDLTGVGIPALAAGFFASFIVGYLTIQFLFRVIQKGNFFVFGLYSLVLGILTFGYICFF